MSQVIYARVPDTVKEDVEGYADVHGLTLSSAAVDLLQRGLAAAAEEKSITNLETKVAKLNADKVSLEAKLSVATTETSAFRSFAQRASTTNVGACPSCSKPISGLDLLGTGRCSQCQTSLLDLLAPQKAKPLLDERAVGALVGALGVILIAAVVMGGGA
jgi:hypothetical protein